MPKFPSHTLKIQKKCKNILIGNIDIVIFHRKAALDNANEDFFGEYMF